MANPIATTRRFSQRCTASALASENAGMMSVGIDIGGKQHVADCCREGQDKADREVLRMSQDRAGFGRTTPVLDDVLAALDVDDVVLYSETTFDDTRTTMETHRIDVVITGSGLDLETRLRAVEHVFSVSTSMTVHMKDWDSGPGGMLPFVKSVLSRPAPSADTMQAAGAGPPVGS